MRAALVSFGQKRYSCSPKGNSTWKQRTSTNDSTYPTLQWLLRRIYGKRSNQMDKMLSFHCWDCNQTFRTFEWTLGIWEYVSASVDETSKRSNKTQTNTGLHLNVWKLRNEFAEEGTPVPRKGHLNPQISQLIRTSGEIPKRWTARIQILGSQIKS